MIFPTKKEESEEDEDSALLEQLDIPDHSGWVKFRPERQKNTGSLILLST